MLHILSSRGSAAETLEGAHTKKQLHASIVMTRARKGTH